MPYVKQEIRPRLEQGIAALLDSIAAVVEKPSDLSGVYNYCISRLITDGMIKNYDQYNMRIGVLEAVKLELYRRQVAPYEDTKIAENGDVYDDPLRAYHLLNHDGGVPRADDHCCTQVAPNSGGLSGSGAGIGGVVHTRLRPSGS